MRHERECVLSDWKQGRNVTVAFEKKSYSQWNLQQTDCLASWVMSSKLQERRAKKRKEERNSGAGSKPEWMKRRKLFLLFPWWVICGVRQLSAASICLVKHSIAQ